MLIQWQTKYFDVRLILVFGVKEQRNINILNYTRFFKLVCRGI